MPTFGITPVSGFPPVTDTGFPRFIQWREDGSDVGSRSVENVNFTGDVALSVSSDGATVTVDVTGGSTPGDLPWLSVKDYGALGNGRVLTDVGTTNGDATVTSASGAFTSSDTGKVFEVTNNASVFRSTIASINSSTSIELAANVTFTATNCVAHFGTDDTVGIQATIDAAITAGGGTVLFPLGIYIVNGALQDTSRSNSQLLLPRINTNGGPPMAVTLLGEVAPAPIPSVVAAVALPRGGSILKSTLNTTGGTSPCFIGGHGPSGSASNFSNAYVTLKNLCVRMPVNPVLTAVDLSHMACVEVDDVVIDSGQYLTTSIAEPTTSSSYGLVMPKQSNGAHSLIGACDVIGFYWGYQFAEHTNGVNVAAWGCKRAFEFFGLTDHASVFQRVMANHCEQVIVAGGGGHWLQIQQLNIEHVASGWLTTDYDIYDPNNRLVGDLHWHVVLANVGNDATFTVDGGASLDMRRVGFNGVEQVISSAALSIVGFHANKHIYHPAADTSARTWTIPANSSVPFPIGTTLTFINENGAGTLTIAITTDTMRLAGAGTTGSRTLAANGQATAIKVTSTSWQINGVGLT